MRKFTWYWLVAVATTFITLLLTAPARPDDFADHLRALEAQNAAAKAGCACDKILGKCCCTPESFCESGTVCPVVAAQTPKDPVTSHREYVVPVVGKRYRHPDNGRWYTYQTDGYWHQDPIPVRPQMYYQPAPVSFSNCST